MTAALLLEPVPARSASVRRSRLVDALVDPAAPPLSVLVAPAGFGKTTLLREWSVRDPRPFAWITLTVRHDAPSTLLRAVAAAVDDAMATTTDGRVVLVLDDVQRLHSAAAHETLAAIVTDLPPTVSVALASRTQPPVPVPRLRAEGLVTELRHGALAMTRSEAAALLYGAGVPLGREDVDALVRTTEGWPAALSLAACALSGQPAPGAAAARFGGGDQIVAEYLHEEVLDALSEDERAFLRRTAILDVLSAAVCDSVLERHASAATLATLARSGVPLVALDRTGERYRHHRLLGDLFRAELRRTEPELEVELHRRASVWHDRAGDRARGIRHALAAHELERAAELVWAGVPHSIAQGTSAAVEHELSQFTNAQLAAQPRLALAAAATALAHGHGDVAEHWLTAAAAASSEQEIVGGAAALRAALGRDGVDRVAADARDAAAQLAPESPCQALCGLLLGVADHLRGEPEKARPRLEDAARRAAVLAPQVQTLGLAQLALLALDEHDDEGAARLAARARAQCTRYGLDRYPTAALVLAVAALVRAQRGMVEDARADAAASAVLLEQLTDVAPWHELEVRIVLARAALRLSDVNEARRLLAGTGRLAARLPEAITLQRWLSTVETDITLFAGASQRPCESLTTAELRVLGFLPTHLTFREIAGHTFVSANTVKTQANAVYRKLGVRSRSAAVARAREVGLLDYVVAGAPAR